MMPKYLDINIEKNKAASLPHAIDKNQLKMDERPKHIG